jgi:hypothetical protein
LRQYNGRQDINRYLVSLPRHRHAASGPPRTRCSEYCLRLASATSARRIVVVRSLQLVDHRLSVTICHRPADANPRNESPISRRTRHQRPAAQAAHGRQGRWPGDPTIRASAHSYLITVRPGRTARRVARGTARRLARGTARRLARGTARRLPRGTGGGTALRIVPAQPVLSVR